MCERQRLVDVYADAWNEPDVEQRYVLIKTAWAEDGVYHARGVEARGHRAINDTIAHLRRTHPDRVFRRTSDLFSRRDRARYTWALLDPTGTATLAGVDHARFDTDGRLLSVTRVHDHRGIA